MSNPTNYELLVNIDNKIDNLRNDLSRQITKNEEDIVQLRMFQSNLMGKIGIGVVVVGGFVAFIMNFVIDWVKSKL